MMITCRVSLSVMILRFFLSLYLTNRVGWGFLGGLGDEGAAEVEPARPDLGLVVEAVRLAAARAE